MIEYIVVTNAVCAFTIAKILNVTGAPNIKSRRKYLKVSNAQLVAVSFRRPSCGGTNTTSICKSSTR